MSRQGATPEEMLSLAKTMAKGEGVQGAGSESSYQSDNQQSGYNNVSGQQMGTEDPFGQQNGYSNTADQQGNVNIMSGQQGTSGTTGAAGLQAQEAGLGQGFNQGFGQGLSGDPDGSQPHDGIQVQQEVTPDCTSQDTDLHTTGNGSGGGYETHQHHHDSFAAKSYVQGS
ncbi:hypothetical protein ABBQ38_004455 [Trebouxia sp. C0009 RCD-2024]